jgi:hypothetical protein
VGKGIIAVGRPAVVRNRVVSLGEPAVAAHRSCRARALLAGRERSGKKQEKGGTCDGS